MNQSGDGLYGQPGESVDSLSDIAGLMDGDAAPEQEETLEESGEEEQPDDAEVDEAEAADDEAAEDDAEDVEITLKHEGKEVRVSKAKAIELAQQGFDYTQKTMQVAEQRKAVEAERETVKQVRTQYEQVLDQQIHHLQALAQFTEAQLGEPPSTDLLNYDTAAYLLQKEQHEARKGQLNQTFAAIEQLQHEQARQRHAWIAEQADQTEKALRDTLPGWNDNTLNDLAGYAASLGLRPETVDVAFVQKGFWEALHKARQYDELQARKAQLKPKAELPKVTKPSASNQTPRGIVAKQAAEKAYAKKPSLDSLAALL